MSTTGRFAKIEKLGEGTYGVVYMAREKVSGSVVALKRMNVASEEEGVPSTTIREISLLKELHHPNVVRLLDVMFQSPKLTLVFEYCDYDLKKLMDSKPGKVLDVQTDLKPILKQLLCGLQYCHANNVVHRDLKPQNILVTGAMEVKLADFGLARVDGLPVKKYTHEAVTLWYRPPDVILGSTNYGFAVDMWSVGCIFAEMAMGKPLFNGHTDSEQLHKYFKLLGSPTRESWPSMSSYPNYRSMLNDSRSALDCVYPSMLQELVRNTSLSQIGEVGVDLLQRMLVYEPSRRVTAAEALAHPFLADVETPKESQGVGAVQLAALMDAIEAATSQDLKTPAPPPYPRPSF